MGDANWEFAFFASVTGENTVTLRWVVSSVEGILGFNIERSTEPDTGVAVINAELLRPESPGQHEDTTVEGGTEYWYHLFALMETGEEQQLNSEPITVTTWGNPVREVSWGCVEAQYR